MDSSFLIFTSGRTVATAHLCAFQNAVDLVLCSSGYSDYQGDLDNLAYIEILKTGFGE
jgi:hypothetical protein